MLDLLDKLTLTLTLKSNKIKSWSPNYLLYKQRNVANISRTLSQWMFLIFFLLYIIYIIILIFIASLIYGGYSKDMDHYFTKVPINVFVFHITVWIGTFRPSICREKGCVWKAQHVANLALGQLGQFKINCMTCNEMQETATHG